MFRRLQPHHTMILEAGLLGLFFVQAARFLIAMIYSRVAGASAVTALQAIGTVLPDPLPVDPLVVSREMTTLGYLLILPLIAIFIGHWRLMPLIAAGLVIAGRLLMFDYGVLTPTAAAALTVCSGLLYIAVVARHRMRVLPYFFVLGFAADMLIRMFGNTLDLSTEPGFLNTQLILSAIAALLAFISLLLANRQARLDESSLTADRGLIPLWGAVGMGGLLYLWLSLFGLPNAVAARAGVDYTLFAPAILAAALLPIIPAVRGMARGFIGAFDGGVRGWLWMLLIALCIVLGTRLNGLIAGVSLTIATFMSAMLWWWIARPKGEKERTLGGLWLIVGIGFFVVLLLGDNFTYEYAYVRDLTGNLAFLNPYIPPLLRGFRGFGFVLLLMALLLASLPMTQTRHRIAWMSGVHAVGSFLVFLAVGGAVAGAITAVRPVLITGVRGVDSITVATFNIHSGYDEYYTNQLESVAQTIQESGADVVLLQETEAGRLASFGVDQPLWLARRLGMDTRFFGTNEDLHGLAVLSKVEIAFDDGQLLDSLGVQTGVQRVQIIPDTNVVVSLYNTWLSPLLSLGTNDLEDQEQDQQRQLNEIFTTELHGACSRDLGYAVVGGTMHNVPDSPLMQQMHAAGFSDPFAGLPIEIGATFVRQGQPRARFDYLWLCNLPSSGVGVLPSAASDHRIAFSGVVLR